MKRIERIVVGVDLGVDRIGPTAELAITEARIIAEASGAQITLLHSTRADERWDDGTKSYAGVPKSREEDDRAIIDRAVPALRAAGIDCRVVITDAPPGLAIVQEVLRTRADLAIVGRRTDAHHDDRRMGSVSLNVVRHCPCLVWVVSPASQPRPRVIVAATDGGPVGSEVVTSAAMLSSLCGSVLHAVHTIQIGMEVQMEGADAEREFVERRRREIRATVEAQAAAAGFQGELHVHAGVTTPTRGVLDALKRLQPDLVAMGTISRGGIPGLLVGNTAERLLGTINCSLLVAKPADFVCPVKID
jgi:universal stress protein E